MSAPASPVSAPFFAPDPLLHDLLAVSLTAINLLRPCYSPTGELDDFAPEYFNPAAQRMTGLPERPAGTARTLFPDIFTNGIFAFYRQVFETGEPDQLQRYYQADGLDNYFQIAARRSSDRLWVSFTDTADQSRTAAENALRESQAAEQAARAEAEVQRQRFYDLLMQLPAQVAVHEGPDQVFTLVNPGYQRLAPDRELQGQPIREAWPEFVSQGILDVLDHVYQTGEPFIGKELPFQVDFTRTNTFEQVYFNAFFLPLRDVQGNMRGVLDYSYDVTEHVLARQQTEQLNQQLAAAQAATERERSLLQAMFAQAPVAIALFQGEDVRVASVNEHMAALWGRTPAQVLGQPLLEGVPELRGQGFDEMIQQVQATGVPYVNTQLTRSNVDLDTFVYTASHDLKAPITNIESIVIALRDTLPTAVQQDEVVAHLLELLDTTVSRFRFTIGQLTDISKLQLAHAGPAEPVLLAQAIENVCLDLVPAITSADTRLTVEVAPKLVVSFSPSNLRSIVYNLLSNAIKYRAAERPSQVRVRAEQTASEVVLTV